ncbi:hypothetical protein [Bacteroides sp.]|uniref:hypothetical protein n=1 Tax=Bacteroides sp. TaxID=29523 RepID=UPI00260704ED|nr:hypothetical protein [Bacteroides sp.]MDD3040059.1 hypothetical protein [Bacteroides sp.]
MSDRVVVSVDARTNQEAICALELILDNIKAGAYSDGVCTNVTITDEGTND